MKLILKYLPTHQTNTKLSLKYKKTHTLVKKLLRLKTA